MERPLATAISSSPQVLPVYRLLLGTPALGFHLLAFLAKASARWRKRWSRTGRLARCRWRLR
jgi:hypothetical protein